MEENNFKSGFVNIVGNPNVGKSTLMNALVGEQLSIITSKAQTTRHRILGIVTENDCQIVFSDTPGVLKPNYKLQESMMKFVYSAIGDADIILYVTDVVEKSDKNIDFIEKLNVLNVPILLLVNKIDLTTPEELESLTEKWKTLLPSAIIFPISALLKFNLDNLKKEIARLLPYGPKYYDNDALTDRTLRFFASEIIREKIFLNYQKEIPYSTEVVVEEFKEEANITRIEAVIYVTRESQKGIIIGKQGLLLKKTGTAARKSLETFLQTKVYLGLHVKVDPDWRNNKLKLKNFGYIQE
ncbi:MAG: GTPase Era [Prevotellaceae bacterium]|jgi:GTP-binding protein Era|nr:GTPase Era [Prevotellaceae bacterium]